MTGFDGVLRQAPHQEGGAEQQGEVEEPDRSQRVREPLAQQAAQQRPAALPEHVGHGGYQGRGAVVFVRVEPGERGGPGPQCEPDRNAVQKPAQEQHGHAADGGEQGRAHRGDEHGGEKDSPASDAVRQISQQDKNRQDPCDVDGEDEGQGARPEPEPVGIGGIKSGRQGG